MFLTEEPYCFFRILDIEIRLVVFGRRPSARNQEHTEKCHEAATDKFSCLPRSRLLEVPV